VEAVHAVDLMPEEVAGGWQEPRLGGAEHLERMWWKGTRQGTHRMENRPQSGNALEVNVNRIDL
jgi:hypothetical protein